MKAIGMLNNETRELLISLYEKCRNGKRVAEDFSVSLSCVYYLVNRKRKMEAHLMLDSADERLRLLARAAGKTTHYLQQAHCLRAADP